jgi:hypothetical protein
MSCDIGTEVHNYMSLVIYIVNMNVVIWAVNVARMG